MTTFRALLSRAYPLHAIDQALSRLTHRFRYHWLARSNAIELYPTTREERLLTDLRAIDLLRRVETNHDWVPALLPAGGAADHKFLYILARALVEFRFESILEFGSGETTRLLDAFAGETGSRVTTIEHDAFWADRLRGRGLANTHEIFQCPLATVHGATVGPHSWYELGEAASALPSGCELYLVDGPPGTRTYSRVGFVEFFLAHRGEEWLVLWDDVDRLGDLQSFALLLRELRRANVDFEHHLFVSSRTLGAVFTRRYRAVRYYL